MPSRTPKQKRTMAAAAHNKKFANKMEIPQKVARDYVAADQGRSPPPHKGFKKAVKGK